MTNDNIKERHRNEALNAVRRGRVDILSGMLADGFASLDYWHKEDSLMYEAIRADQREIVRLLITMYPEYLDEIDEDEDTLIHHAAWYGRIEIIELLLNAGSKSLDALNESASSPIMLAAEAGNYKTVERLVELGSTQLHASRHEKTIFHAAVDIWYRSQEDKSARQLAGTRTLETIIRLGNRDIDTQDYNGDTPLFDAVVCDDAYIVETLIRLGSNAIDIPNNAGKTPLHFATQRRSISTIKTLVQLGSRAFDSCTPFTVACYGKDHINCRYLHAIFPHLQQCASSLDCIPDEDECLAARYETYFERSLAGRLFFANDRLHNQRLILTNKH